MSSLSPDPKITLAVYIGASIFFLAMLTWMFVYNRRMKGAKRVEELKGRPPADMEEGILIATREKEGRQIPKP
jgi:hypothetical protein